MDKQAQMAEREARQQIIDANWVGPIWSPLVDEPLLEMCMDLGVPKSPIILMPELRFKFFLMRLLEFFERPGKVMVVDATNARFEILRENAQSVGVNLYFSTQDVAQLNYSDNIFHLILTEIGLSTLVRLDDVLASYRRVLRPEGHLVFSAPIQGTFPQFFDIFDECLFKINPNASRAQKDLFADVMYPESIVEIIEQNGFELKEQRMAELVLNFQSAEQLLFSSLVESHYLGYCLNMYAPGVDYKLLLTNLVRAFHHYFQGESVSVPMRVGIFSAEKI